MRDTRDHSSLMMQVFSVFMHSNKYSIAHHLLWLTYTHNNCSALQSPIVPLRLSDSFCWGSWQLTRHCSSCIQLQTKRYACSCVMHFRLLDRVATVVFIGSATVKLLLLL